MEHNRLKPNRDEPDQPTQHNLAGTVQHGMVHQDNYQMTTLIIEVRKKSSSCLYQLVELRHYPGTVGIMPHGMSSQSQFLCFL